MEQPSAAATRPRSPNDSYIARGMAGASVGLGFFSVCVFWWTPFAGILATVGFLLGVISLIRGVKGGLRGENYAMVGTLLCATSLTIALTLNQALRYLQWDEFPIYPL